MAEDLTDALEESLRHLGDEFKPNRLAYLSLTSKNERLLCGALAYRLHEKFADDPNVTIRREWSSKVVPRRPVDIAVLREGEPTMLIEAKAAMALDPLVKGVRVYPSRDVLADAEKLKNFKEVNQRYTLTFFTIYDGLPDEEHHAAITYIDGIKKRPDAKDRFQESVRRFRKKVGYSRPAACGDVPAGRAFGVNVSVWYELMAVSN